MRVGLERSLEPRGSKVDEHQQSEDERHRGTDLAHRFADIAAADDEGGDDREVDRDEQILVDEGPEHRIRFVVCDPAEIDERLGDDCRRGDVDDSGDDERGKKVAEKVPAKRHPDTEIQDEIDRPGLSDAVSGCKQSLEVELKTEEKQQEDDSEFRAQVDEVGFDQMRECLADERGENLGNRSCPKYVLAEGHAGENVKRDHRLSETIREHAGASCGGEQHANFD